jgi:AraC-like DNA-binding protein
MGNLNDKSGPPLIRLGHPLAFTNLIRDVGGPTDRYLRHAKLPVLCSDPDMRVPLLRAWAFFATAAEHEDPMLGWLVGAHVGDHNLNAGLLSKLQQAPTLLRALQRLLQLASSEASHIQLGMYQRQADILICTHYPGMRETPGYMVAQAYQLGVILDVIRHFLGRHWVPEEIGIEQRTVPAMVEKHFPGCRIMAQQPMGYIAVPRTCLHHAAPLRSEKSGVVENQALSENLDLLDTLRTVLKAYLPDGYPSARFAAMLMDVSERTLARRLSAHGLTYGELIDEIRFVEAKRLLQQPGARVEDVGAAVGFVDQSNFARMFRRLGGLSPKEFQKAALD